MFDFLKKLFPFLSKTLSDADMEAIRKMVEKELKNVPAKAKTATISIKIDPKVSEELANIFLEKLAKEYGDKLGKRLILMAVK